MDNPILYKQTKMTQSDIAHLNGWIDVAVNLMNSTISLTEIYKQVARNF